MSHEQATAAPPETFEEWLAERPDHIRDLAKLFPAGRPIEIGEDIYYVVGYSRNNMVMISKIDPEINHAAAMASRQYVSVEFLRKD